MNNLLYSLLLIIILLSSVHIGAQQNKETLMKGIAYRQLEGKGNECNDIDKLNVSWYYNWTPEPNCASINSIEFIPMIWSEKYLFDENYKKYLLPLIGSDYQALLGYNEPNWDGQAEMSVRTALRYWPMLEKTGLRLGSPSTTGRSGLDWTIEFMKGVKEKGYRVDFLALHWYGNCSCTDYLKDFLDYYDAWGMPMWLTEWSCYRQDMKTNTEFLKKAIPLLNSYESLERYAWYSNRTTSESYKGAALFDSTGIPTSVGEIYQDYPAIHEKKIEPVGVPDIELEIVDFHEGPVLGKNNPGTGDIRHGFEGGRVIKHKGTYHLFTSEQSGDPKWVKMRLGHWKSSDGLNWERVSTLMESSGDFTGEDPRASLWSPMPVFNNEDSTWYMTYVAYRCKPDTRQQFLNNFDGRIWQARSKIRGYDGLGGPYEGIGIIMEQGVLADDWEGLQGTDSFFPFRAGNKWLAFMGSAKTEKLPITFWGNGLALAPALTGPWIRLSARNPVEFGVNFTENPIVTRLDDGLFIAIMDSHGEGFGYAVSPDGIHWSKLKILKVVDKMDSWWFEFRTPLSLIREDDSTYTVFFTAMKDKTDYWQHIGEEGYVLDTGFDSMGKLSVRISIKSGNCQKESTILLIRIYPDSILSDVSHHPVGINLDYFMDDDNYLKPERSTTDALKAMGVKYLRYPGGNKSDFYFFSVPPYEKSVPTLARTGKGAVGGRHKMLNNYSSFKYDVLDFDEFMAMCKEIGGVPTICVAADEYLVDYPEGCTKSSREELIEHAVEWVRYANIKKNYNIKYWMIGNETWHKQNVNSTPEIYANDVIAFSKEMKAVDSTIYIIPNGNGVKFWEPVIKKAGDYIDYLCMSNYPVYEYKAGYLTYRDTLQNLTLTAKDALKALDKFGTEQQKERLKLIVCEYGSMDWAGNWPYINNMGHSLCTFEMTGEFLKNPKVEFSQFWNTRWINNDKEENSIFDALDRNGNFNSNGFALSIWGNFLGEKMVKTTSTIHIRSFASYVPETGKLYVYLLNKTDSIQAVNLQIENSKIRSLNQHWILAGNGPEDTDPVYRQQEIISGRSPQDIILPGTSISVLEYTIIQ